MFVNFGYNNPKEIMQSNYCRKNQTFKVGYDDPWRKSKITQNVISNRTMQGTPGESSTV